MSHSKETLDAQMFVWIALLVLVMFIIPAVYATNIAAINGALMSIAKVQLGIFASFFSEAYMGLVRISSVDPASLTWEQMQGVLRYVGTWLRWPCLVILAVLGTISIFMGKVGNLTRRLNMDKLLAHNAESFACLRPIVGKGKYLLSPESYDKGLWRIARSPVQFAVEHKLLVDEQNKPFTEQEVLHNGLAHTDLAAYGQARLDMKKTEDVLTAQLGKAFKNFEKLTPHRQALACAFLSYGAGEKSVCMEVLDTLSSSYMENENIPSCPVVDEAHFQEKITNLWEKHEYLLKDKLMQRHTSFELVWFMALLTFARRKGVLASSQFLWLRPLDRPLWYALNQCGGRTAWAEGFAAWAHFAAEEKAGVPLAQAHVAHASYRLKETLSQQGWLTEKPMELLSSGAEIKDDRVFCPAEDNPEDVPEDDYDANKDAKLHAEMY